MRRQWSNWALTHSNCRLQRPSVCVASACNNQPHDRSTLGYTFTLPVYGPRVAADPSVPVVALSSERYDPNSHTETRSHYSCVQNQTQQKCTRWSSCRPLTSREELLAATLCKASTAAAFVRPDKRPSPSSGRSLRQLSRICNCQKLDGSQTRQCTML